MEDVVVALLLLMIAIFLVVMVVWIILAILVRILALVVVYCAVTAVLGLVGGLLHGFTIPVQALMQGRAQVATPARMAAGELRAERTLLTGGTVPGLFTFPTRRASTGQLSATCRLSVCVPLGLFSRVGDPNLLRDSLETGRTPYAAWRSALCSGSSGRWPSCPRSVASLSARQSQY